MQFVRLFAFLFVLAGFARAHQVESVELEFKDLGQSWELTGEIDIAYMLPETRNVPGGLPLSRAAVMKYPPAELARIRRETEIRLRELIRITIADKDVPWRIGFPDFQKEPFALPEDAGDAAYVTCVLTADAVPGPGELRIHWSGEQETELIVLTDLTEGMRIVSALPGDSLVLFKKAADDQPPAKPQPVSAGWVRSGFHHVMGADHVLFILGLFFLAPGWRALLSQSLVFTLAHSMSLALAVFGMVTVPSVWVEHLIALSIAWVGIENLVTRKLGRQRFVLVFCFGLLHGLGFAGVLAEKLHGISGASLTWSLLGFNCGVEIAQVAILAAAFLFLWPVRKFTVRIQTLGSAFIAFAGIAWAVQRLLFPGSPVF